MVLIDNIEPDEGLFRHDVLKISGAIRRRHLKMQRLKNKNYVKAILIASEAYTAAMKEMMGTNITVNATVRLIQMKYNELLKRVYGIDSSSFESLKKDGIQTHTMDSVRVANCFIRNLETYYEIIKIGKKMGHEYGIQQ